MKQIAKSDSIISVIKKSKFLGFCHPIESIETVRQIIADYEKEYHKANHVCWAFRFHENDQALGYSSDAGEPTGSAGPPILSAIEGRELINTLCVVVRYFGGIKLGVGGLIRAYRGVAADTLDKAGVKTIITMSTLVINGGHSEYPGLMKLIGKYPFEFTQDFQENGFSLKMTLPPDKKELLVEDLSSFRNIHLE